MRKLRKLSPLALLIVVVILGVVILGGGSTVQAFNLEIGVSAEFENASGSELEGFPPDCVEYLVQDSVAIVSWGHNTSTSCPNGVNLQTQSSFQFSSLNLVDITTGVWEHIGDFFHNNFTNYHGFNTLTDVELHLFIEVDNVVTEHVFLIVLEETINTTNSEDCPFVPIITRNCPDRVTIDLVSSQPVAVEGQEFALELAFSPSCDANDLVNQIVTQEDGNNETCLLARLNIPEGSATISKQWIVDGEYTDSVSRICIGSVAYANRGSCIDIAYDGNEFETYTIDGLFPGENYLAPEFVGDGWESVQYGGTTTIYIVAGQNTNATNLGFINTDVYDEPVVVTPDPQETPDPIETEEPDECDVYNATPPISYFSGSVNGPGNVTLTNNGPECALASVVVYSVFSDGDDWLSSQELFASHSEVLAPGEIYEFTVATPDCQSQTDPITGNQFIYQFVPGSVTYTIFGILINPPGGFINYDAPLCEVEEIPVVETTSEPEPESTPETTP